MQFVLRVPANASEGIKNPYFNANNTWEDEIPIAIQPGQYLEANGNGKVTLNSSSHKQIKVLNIPYIKMVAGDNFVDFDYTRMSFSDGPEITVNFRFH